jgi:hypothetical protein
VVITALDQCRLWFAAIIYAELWLDQDVFRTTFVPNSPCQIDASVASGNNIYFQFYDARLRNKLRFQVTCL